MLNDAIENGTGVCAIRYPRGGELYKPNGYIFDLEDFSVFGNKDSKIAIVTYGRVFSNACKAKEMLSIKGVEVCCVKLNKLKPIHIELVETLLNFKEIYFFEEGILNGGIGEHLSYILSEHNYSGKIKVTAINDKFVSHASTASILKKLHLDEESMVNIVLKDRLENEK